MTNEQWLNTLSVEKKAKFLVKNCNFCSRDCIDKYCSENVCENGIKEWLKKEYKEPMPEIKIGDVIYCNIGNSKAKFVVMSDMLANNLYGVTARWRELENIWQIKRIDNEKEMLEIIWRADND